MCSGPRVVDVVLYPVWAGDSTDIEHPTNKWFAAHAVSVDGEKLHVCEHGPHLEDAAPRIDEHIAARARVWDVGRVVSTGHYPPSITLALRRGAFGVSAATVLEVTEVGAVEISPLSRRTASAPLPRPTTDVPAFSVCFEPRVTNLPEAASAAIRALSIVSAPVI
jgi:hypothetical protein